MIDITSHRAITLDSEREGKSILTSPAGMIVGGGKHIFKLIPPAPGKASRALTFTPQRVHTFACESAESMKKWINALTKATIELDDSSPVVTTYQADTISLESAQEAQTRPPNINSEAPEDASEADDDPAEPQHLFENTLIRSRVSSPRLEYTDANSPGQRFSPILGTPDPNSRGMFRNLSKNSSFSNRSISSGGADSFTQDAHFSLAAAEYLTRTGVESPRI